MKSIVPLCILLTSLILVGCSGDSGSGGSYSNCPNAASYRAILNELQDCCNRLDGFSRPGEPSDSWSYQRKAQQYGARAAAGEVELQLSQQRSYLYKQYQQLHAECQRNNCKRCSQYAREIEQVMGDSLGL